METIPKLEKLEITNTQDATSQSLGALHVLGGATFDKNVRFGADGSRVNSQDFVTKDYLAKVLQEYVKKSN